MVQIREIQSSLDWILHTPMEYRTILYIRSSRNLMQWPFILVHPLFVCSSILSSCFLLKLTLFQLSYTRHPMRIYIYIERVLLLYLTFFNLLFLNILFKPSLKSNAFVAFVHTTWGANWLFLFSTSSSFFFFIFASCNTQLIRALSTCLISKIFLFLQF